jgi:hypothetical protein
MTIEATAALGTILAVGDSASPEVFTKIGRVKDVDGPSMSRDTIDTTHQLSPGGVKEFLASLADGGDVSFTVGYNPSAATHDQTTGLLKFMGETTTRNWKLVFPVAATSGFWGLEFKGVVTKFAPKAPVAGELTADITIKVAGNVVQADIDISDICS